MLLLFKKRRQTTKKIEKNTHKENKRERQKKLMVIIFITKDSFGRKLTPLHSESITSAEQIDDTVNQQVTQTAQNERNNWTLWIQKRKRNAPKAKPNRPRNCQATFRFQKTTSPRTVGRWREEIESISAGRSLPESAQVPVVDDRSSIKRNLHKIDLFCPITCKPNRRKGLGRDNL